MFGRRKREERAEETAREADRRALFAELAKRPEGVCPFLGLADARAAYRPEPNGEHRCYAFGDPAPLSDEQQRHVCLERGYSNCPRYLRGVLVIPTEELEALRHPQAPAPPPPAPAPAPAGGGGRRGLIVLPLLLLLIAAVAAGGWYVLNQASPVANSTPTPSPSSSVAASILPSPSAEPSQGPSATPVPTPIVVPSSGALPTPGPDDTSTGGYAVYVKAGSFPVFRLDDAGAVIGEATATFSRVSAAPVQRVVGQDGAIYWKTLIGTYTGLAYTKDRSGGFTIYEVYRTPSGTATFRQLADSEL